MFLLLACTSNSTDSPEDTCPPRYRDGDGDGWGNPERPVARCDEGVEDGLDCDDSDPDIHPEAPEEACTDPIDRNCDGRLVYADVDGDGWAACVDCDDNDSNRHPDEEEWCNDEDDDCDGAVDEAAVDWKQGWADLDGDGFAGADAAVWACPDDPAIHWSASDCDDGDPSVFPGAVEICDGKDNDCDGTIAEPLVPSDYATIQEAMDAGAWMDWICVLPGNYRETLEFPAWDVTVESSDGPEWV